jgi:transcriptional regulator with XRE-family HTH domain
MRKIFKIGYYFSDMNKTTVPFFGDRLRRIRLEKGLTQTQLGDKVGLSKRMMAHYEKHATRPPTDKVALLANALGVTVEDLLKDTPKNKSIGSDPKFAKKLEKAKSLPKADREVLTTMIDSLLKKVRQKTK